MALLALIVATVALGLSLEHRIRAYVYRRRAVRAIGEAMQTLAAVDKARSFLREQAPNVALAGDLFPKGRN